MTNVTLKGLVDQEAVEHEFRREHPREEETPLIPLGPPQKLAIDKPKPNDLSYLAEHDHKIHEYRDDN